MTAGAISSQFRKGDDVIKKIKVLSWGDAPFQPKFTPLRKDYERYKDLYLKSNICTDGTIQYEVVNDSKELILYAKCYLNGKLPDLLAIYSPETNMKILEVKQEGPFRYSVTQEESVNGTILIQEDRLLYLDPTNAIVYSAILVSGEFRNAVALLKVSSLYFEHELHLAIIDENEKLLGNYFLALRNLDLSPDKELMLDKNVVVALAIIFVESVHPPIDTLRVSFGNPNPM